MKHETIQIRLRPEEKQSFSRASEIAGLTLSAWVRERLRMASAKELEAIGERAPFIDRLTMDTADE